MAIGHSSRYERHVNRLIDAGVDGLFILGSSGEVVFSTDERRRQSFRNVRIVEGRVPVMVGVIDTTTPRVIEQAKIAQELGADAIVATAPFYAIVGPKDIERHFRLIKQAIDLPLFAYDIPVCVHVKLSTDMILDLARDGVLQGVKDSSGDDVSFRNLAMLRSELGLDLALLTGHEVVVDGARCQLPTAVCRGWAMLTPGICRAVASRSGGDWDRVRELQDYASPHEDHLRDGRRVRVWAGVGAFKTALMLLGVFETNDARTNCTRGWQR